jgi:hypothetical protein
MGPPAFALEWTVRLSISSFQLMLEVSGHDRCSDVQSHSTDESSRLPWSMKTQSRRGRRAGSSGMRPDSSQLSIQMTRRGWQMLSSGRNRSEVSTGYQTQQSSALSRTQSRPSRTAGAAGPRLGTSRPGPAGALCRREYCQGTDSLGFVFRNRLTCCAKFAFPTSVRVGMTDLSRTLDSIELTSLHLQWEV